MRCITVQNPWAELIARGDKQVELRKWSTEYRGPLLIIAAARPSKSPAALAWRGVEGPTSQVVAIGRLVEVRPATPDDAPAACCPVPEGHFAFVLRSVYRVRLNHRVKGRLSITRPEPELREAIARGALWRKGNGMAVPGVIWEALELGQADALEVLS